MRTFKTWTWQLAKLALVAIVIGAIVYQIRFSPVSVSAHTVARDSIVAEVMGTGTLEARVSATVSPKISGRIVELLVDQGAQVSAGDLLVRLDDAELRQQVAIADANVDAALAAIERLKTDKDRAVAVYEQAHRNNERVQTLLQRSAISPEDADKATEALSIAESGTARAEAAIAEAQKELIAAEKTAQYHAARFQDTEIRAPFAGLVVKRNREPGDVVVPGSSMLTLISTDELWISAWVDETEMSKLDTDQFSRVVFRSDPQQSYSGKVARLGREADRETREFIVDVRVLELPKNWAVGQRAETFIQVAQRDDVLVIPANRLLNRDGTSGAYVDVNGVARWRELQLGIRARDTVEVLNGLQAGDVVVAPVTPLATLSEGRSVKHFPPRPALEQNTSNLAPPRPSFGKRGLGERGLVGEGPSSRSAL